MTESGDNDILERIRTVTGRIEDHLELLATCEELPFATLGICLIRIDEAAPPLLALLERAADGEALDDDEASQLFFAVHILGAARVPAAGAPLLRLLRLPEEELDRLIGDTITETLARIAAGVFDGDAEALFAAIADPAADQFVRDALLGAAAFLTWEGRIARDATAAFLERFFRDRLAGELDFAWNGWLDAIALLGLRELRPLVDQAWDEGFLSIDITTPEHFERDLAAAERAPDDAGRWGEARLGYIEDLAGELSWCTWDGDDALDNDDGEDDDLLDAGWGEPAVNPWRDVGRNDPCPCGSGRKFKKCCIGKDGPEEP